MTHSGGRLLAVLHPVFKYYTLKSSITLYQTMSAKVFHRYIAIF